MQDGEPELNDRQQKRLSEMEATVTMTSSSPMAYGNHHHHHPHYSSDSFVHSVRYDGGPSTATTTSTASSLSSQDQQQQQQQQQHSMKRANCEISSLSSSTTKTRNATNTLDCHSLQSSLKRVRLSCSPGELRLQRDLRNLVLDSGWNQTDDHCWCLLESHSSRIPTSGSSSSSSSSSTIARLDQITQHDPLRLLLSVRDRYSVWIQIPRMYPHRPPSISRIHDAAPNTNPTARRVEHIVVHEAPPIGQEPNTPLSCGTTVVFNAWSPVLRLGDLIDFVIRTLSTGHPTNEMTTTAPFLSPAQKQQQQDVMDTSAAGVSSSNFSHPSSMFQPRCHSLSCSSSNSSSSSFIEERKGEECCVEYAQFHLAPNRFDAGYGKYFDPYTAQIQATAAPSNNPSPDTYHFPTTSSGGNAMDVN